LWITIGGNQRSAELECVGSSQRMVHHDALSVKASGNSVRDFSPSRGDFVDVS
jgi:hypothetical protein